MVMAFIPDPKKREITLKALALTFLRSKSRNFVVKFLNNLSAAVISLQVIRMPNDIVQRIVNRKTNNSFAHSWKTSLRSSIFFFFFFFFFFSVRHFFFLTSKNFQSVRQLSSSCFEVFAKTDLQCKIFPTLVRMSCECLTTVLRKHAKISQQSGEKLKLSDIRTNVVRHSHECCETLSN